MKYLLSFVLIAIANHACAQTTIPFAFTSEDENRLIKENDSVKFYVATGDSSRIVCIYDEPLYYKLLSKDRKVLAEGPFITIGEKDVQDGKWIERFDNGKVKISGYYHKGKPVGTWQEFYSNGKLKTNYNYSIIMDKYGDGFACLCGSYQEFYQSGKIKLNGFYAASPANNHDTLEVEDPITGNKVQKVRNNRNYVPVKVSHWEYYTEDGELDKKEDF